MKSHDRQITSRVFYFAGIGPLYGSIVIIIGITLSALVEAIGHSDWPNLQQTGELFTILTIVILCGYVIGVLPAIFAGVVSGFGTNTTQRILLAAVAGGGICFLVVQLSLHLIDLSLSLGFIGALSGLLCAIRWEKSHY